MKQINKMFSLVSTLSGVRRFSIIKLVHPENVLEHTGMVVIFSYLLALKINLRKEQAVNVEEVLRKALVHDWDECVTGDVVRPTKYFSRELREQLALLEESGLAKIADNFQLQEIYEDGVSAKKGLEGYVVKTADLLAAAHRVWEEVLVSHNYAMVNVARNMIEPVNHLLDELSGLINHNEVRDELCNHAYEMLQMIYEVNEAHSANPLEEITL